MHGVEDEAGVGGVPARGADERAVVVLDQRGLHRVGLRLDNGADSGVVAPRRKSGGLLPRLLRREPVGVGRRPPEHPPECVEVGGLRVGPVALGDGVAEGVEVGTIRLPYARVADEHGRRLGGLLLLAGHRCGPSGRVNVRFCQVEDERGEVEATAPPPLAPVWTVARGDEVGVSPEP